MKHTAAALAALSAAACTLSQASAQVQFLSAVRTIYAGGGRSGEPPVFRTFSSEDLGVWWEATASVSLGYAHQRSFIGEDGVVYHADVGSGGGAGHHGAGISTLTARILVESDMRWDLTNDWTRVPMEGHRLVRLSDGSNMFAGVNWYAQPGAASGYLAPGLYELRLNNALYDAGFDASEDFTLAFSVPAPGTLALPALAAVLACGRRRR